MSLIANDLLLIFRDKQRADKIQPDKFFSITYGLLSETDQQNKPTHNGTVDTLVHI